MTLPTSPNSISASQIREEFGPSGQVSLGAYRVNQSLLGRNWTLDTGIPTSGQIKFSDFHNKTLNIIIDSGTGEDEFNVTLTNYWTDKTKTCIGEFKTPAATLSDQGAKKYHVILRRDYGGSGSVNTSVKSGSWPSGSILNVYVSNNATIYGRGGDGGYGGYGDSQSGGNGYPGQNAIGFSYDATLTIESGSGIIAGAGGGGGGGGNHHNPDPGPNDPTFTGGNGGGGRGNPGGGGGAKSGTKSKGGDGYEGGGWGWAGGSKGRAGGGGGGGGWDAESIGAGSRGGGAAGNTNGSGGSGGRGGAPSGSGGSPGNAILRTSGTTVTVANNGTIIPSATPVDGTFS
ncbi:MAG: hypothetical protein EBU90_24575 [Proteobacteria bacterium]|nr:hypothetical protein [Pseudomonadota bacterium]